MVADFRRRFWISLVLTIPILALSPRSGALISGAPMGVTQKKSPPIGGLLVIQSIYRLVIPMQNQCQAFLEIVQVLSLDQSLFA